MYHHFREKGRMAPEGFEFEFFPARRLKDAVDIITPEL